MSDAPAVSVIATTYNHEHYVEQCLDAIAAQSFDDFELIIMDDCSSDGSLERIRGWLERTGHPATVIANEKNLGICAARNLAMSRCRGEFLSFVAGDDYYEPDKLERQVALFRALDASVGVVFANCNRLDGDALVGRWFDTPADAVDGWIFDRLLKANHIPAPTVMVRRATFDAVGPYDESLVYEDYDMWLRIADRYQFRYLDHVVLTKRELPSSLSHDQRWRAARLCSRAALLLKWVGRDPASDVVIAARVWPIGRRLLVDDPARAHEYLRAVYELAPTASRRAFLMASRAPGSAAVLRRAFEVRDAVTPRVRRILARRRS